MTDLPPLPTMGVGSQAAPGWFTAAWRLGRKGELGAHDLNELFDDATRIVLADQIDAGVDILCDGELRRQRFVYEMFDRLTGLERVPPARRLGIAGYDMAPHFVVRDAILAPQGLGAVEEYVHLTRLAPPGRPLKIAIPGPLTFAGAIALDAGHTAEEVLDQLIAIVHREMVALSQAGADHIQLDEPGLAIAPYGLPMEAAAEVINATLEGVAARTAIHVCFGNNAGRPNSIRRLDRLLPAVERLACDQLVLEFANREMAEVELMAGLAERFEIAAGVIDVKNFHVEDAEEVAERIRLCLNHIPVERLSVTADCGYSALPRYLAMRKMIAMVEGTALVRGSL